ncbi:ABC transporter substrate-binding protein (plasmid) [Pseudorhodobacter turbinis]|uniref:ABC transporter substrate-binding protein n=1 Tax=Pseudorhodobacter turbinis TaxID=2500533 RepID=A0A4P8EIN2_9RHOB|nr:ABC transporter substrate-binding protein [Pseudorhodobacter turbinis]QCO56692.1 ABC transporter substrate-binding protein [Pseudorhodobacter turbinis]
MKKLLILSTAIGGLSLPAVAQEVNIMGWGGSYTVSQVEAYHKPYAEKTGAKVVSIDADNPATPIKAQVEAGNVSFDIASVEFADAVRFCDEGLLELIDPAILTPAPDGTPAMDDFLPDTVTDCFVPTDVYATVIAYDGARYDGKEAPATMADFFDLEAFPGKRGARKNAKVLLEMALIGDGVATADIYSMLETSEGVDRAFAKLDDIKSEMIWWEAGAQPPQLLADGEVAMTVAYNGRIFNANVSEGREFEIIWDGQVYDVEGWVVPKGAPNLETALDFIAYSTSTEPLAKAAEWISYGPPRKSSAPLVGMYQDGKTEMGPNLPTSPENMGNALFSNLEFWADRDAELNERFNAWLLQ